MPPRSTAPPECDFRTSIPPIKHRNLPARAENDGDACKQPPHFAQTYHPPAPHGVEDYRSISAQKLQDNKVPERPMENDGEADISQLVKAGLGSYRVETEGSRRADECECARSMWRKATSLLHFGQ